METNNHGPRPSAASDVAAPVLEKLVTLKHLKTHEGRPVEVLCRAVDPTIYYAAAGRLPSARPPRSPGPEGADVALERAVATAEMVRDIGPAMISAGTALVGPDGEIVSPAFSFEELPPGQLPGGWLRFEDKGLLLVAIMEVSGLLEGPADALSFPIDGAGRPDGDGAMVPDEGAREILAGTSGGSGVVAG